MTTTRKRDALGRFLRRTSDDDEIVFVPFDEVRDEDFTPVAEPDNTTWSDSQIAFARSLLAQGITVENVETAFIEPFVQSTNTIQHIPTTEVNPMSTTTQYDSAAIDAENTPLAEMIDAAGVEHVAEGIIAANGTSVVEDLAEDPAGTFDWTKESFVPVLDMVATVAEVDDIDNIWSAFLSGDDGEQGTVSFSDLDAHEAVATLLDLGRIESVDGEPVPLKDNERLLLDLLTVFQQSCYKTIDGEPNESYVTQVWLDGNAGALRLFVADVGGDTYVIHTQSFTDGDFTRNVPVAVRRFLTLKAAEAYAKSMRPKPTAADKAAMVAKRASAAAALRKVSAL